MRIDKKGQGLIEYIIIVAIVAVGSMAVMRHVSKNLNHKMAQISDAIQGKKVRANSKDKIDSKITGKKDMGDFFRQVSSSEAKK